MDFLNGYMIPVVSGICLCVGYVTKKWVTDIDNKYIPTICAVAGVMVAVWVNKWIWTPEIVLSGLVSGLGSTGVHQAFKQFIEKKEEK